MILKLLKPESQDLHLSLQSPRRAQMPLGSPEHQHHRALARGRAQAKQCGDRQKHQRAMDWTRPVPPHAKTRLCPLAQALSEMAQPERQDFSAHRGTGCAALGQCLGTGPPWGTTVLPTQPHQPSAPACSLSILRVLRYRGWWWSPSRAVSQGPFAAPLPQPCMLPDNCSQHSPLPLFR